MKVFISHSAQDVDIIGPFSRMVRLAGELRELDVFCTSTRGVPNGDYFVETILDELSKTDLFIAILTDAAIESHFCIAEFGAAQMRKRASGGTPARFFSLVVPPADYDQFKGVLHGLQSGKINVISDLNDLRAILRDLGSTLSDNGWEDARLTFLKDIQQPLLRRDVEARLARELTVLFREIDTPADEVVQKYNIQFTRKYRVSYRNDLGKAIKLCRASWNAEHDEVRADPRSWWTFEKADGSGGWNEGAEIMTVPHNQCFRVGIAFDPHISLEEIKINEVNERLGTLTLLIEVDGISLVYQKHFKCAKCGLLQTTKLQLSSEEHQQGSLPRQCETPSTLFSPSTKNALRPKMPSKSSAMRGTSSTCWKRNLSGCDLP